MEEPQAHTIECFECAEAGQPMSLAGKRPQRVEQIGPVEEFDVIGTYRCAKGHIREEAIPPES